MSLNEIVEELFFNPCPRKLKDFCYCLEKHLQLRGQTKKKFLLAYFLMLETVMCSRRRTDERTNQLLCYLSFLYFSPHLLVSLPLSFHWSVSFICPPPAELTVLDVFGGECAIDDSRNAFREPAFWDILGWYSRAMII